MGLFGLFSRRKRTVEEDIISLRSVTTELEMALEYIDDKNLKKEVFDVLEEVKYSNPKTNRQAIKINNELYSNAKTVKEVAMKKKDQEKLEDALTKIRVLLIQKKNLM